MTPADLRLFHRPAGRLRLTVTGKKSYLSVKPVWAAPVSRRGRYLALLDGKEEEIIMLEDPKVLPPEQLQAVEDELRRRYLTAQVSAVTAGRQEYGATYWSVVTDRGPRDFVTQSLQENAQWVTSTHLLLIDVDNNRFEIQNVQALDEKSRAILHSIL